MKTTAKKVNNVSVEKEIVITSESKAVKIFLASVLVTIMAVIGFGYFLLNTGEKNRTGEISSVVSEQDGTQIIDIKAKGGFSPNFIVANSNKPTKLKITTDNTFDCTSALNIPSLSFTKLLPTTGVTEIDIPTQKKGSEIFGTCNVGLYHFTLKFV